LTDASERCLAPFDLEVKFDAVAELALFLRTRSKVGTPTIGTRGRRSVGIVTIIGKRETIRRGRRPG